ncbi:MAG: glycosyl hydrolase family 18 protein [Chryseolinea sp.]
MSALLCIATLLYSCEPDRIKLGQQNAVWTETIFFRGHSPTTGFALTDADIRQYASTLKTNNIKYSYIFAGPYGSDGHLPAYAFSETAIRSVKKLQEYYPEIVILPWVGGIQGKTVFLNDSSWVSNALNDSKALVKTLGTPGIHIDFEYIIKGHEYLDSAVVKEIPGVSEQYGNYVNEFHKSLRTLLPDAFISSVVVSTPPGTKHWKRKTTIPELETLVQYIDQISFLFYDTHINDRDDFIESSNVLINDIKHLKSGDSGSRVQYLVAIGTFINAPALQDFRNMDIENIPNTLEVIKNSERSIGDTTAIIDGIAIYCNWQTSDDEWKEIRDNWTFY